MYMTPFVLFSSELVFHKVLNNLFAVLVSIVHFQLDQSKAAIDESVYNKLRS